MTYRSTQDVVADLIRHQRCIVVDEPISPNLEMAEIQRRVYASQGPAILFTRPFGTTFPMVSNLFGTLEQARFIFRDTIQQVRHAIELKIDPLAIIRNPWRYRWAPLVALRMQPKRVRKAAVMQHETTMDRLPQLISWPDDGGAFITLPQVLTQAIGSATLQQTNLGMYRIQISGNQYQQNREIGLHYQIHRGIGLHHQAAIAAGVDLPVTISVGGHPAMTLAAVMPLPEGMSELTFAGALAGQRIAMCIGPNIAPIYADADFAIVGRINPQRTKPEGPFGDHLGYYARQHDFPVMTVDKVYHRSNAIWPFTVVGRPPQEDTTFGQLIHELTGPILPTVIPGVRSINAVDAAGVHPLLLAIGSERYMPYRKPDRPAELLTQACAILGQGQLSLAKYLWIANGSDAESLNVHNTEAFFAYMLARVDWQRDLHFITNTTMDTLDYSGGAFNEGSKLIVASSSRVSRKLTTELPREHALPFDSASFVRPGIVAVALQKDVAVNFDTAAGAEPIEMMIDALSAIYRTCSTEQREQWNNLALIVVTDNVEFAARTWNNFLWTTFTRSNPAADIYGVDASTHAKHWGCRGPLVIDARIKPHHAPPLIESPSVTAKIDAMAARGGPLAKYL